MWQDLVLINRGTRVQFELDESWLKWETCMRQIAISWQGHVPAMDLEPLDQVFVGIAAYRFLLEVVSGLHSRVLGENEIVAQFKKRFLEESLRDTRFPHAQKLAHLILTDMKLIRRQHRLNLGAHSYGSFCAMELKSDRAITVLGSGQLATSILPWLLKDCPAVSVVYRSEKSRDELLNALSDRPSHFTTLKWDQWQGVSLDALIITAPFSAQQISEMLERNGVRPRKIIDFRKESHSDPIDHPDLITLHDYFKLSEKQTLLNQAEKIRAHDTIASLCQLQQQKERLEIRTLGWEDLCG